MWIALLCLHYGEFTGEDKYLSLAEDLGLWAAGLNHTQGGIAMGPRRNWQGPWPDVYSSENNLDAYAVFKMLAQRAKDESERTIFKTQAEEIKNFLKEITLKDFSPEKPDKDPRINIGLNPKGIDHIEASDVAALFLLCFTPEELKENFGVTAEQILRYAEERFLVSDEEIEGFDFTSLEFAEGIGRDRMISFEWTSMIASSYARVAEYCPGPQAKNYLSRARALLAQLDKKGLDFDEFRTYPYATRDYTRVFPFAPWWKTPMAEEGEGHPGSVSATCWRLFAGNFNPFSLDSPSDNLNKFKIQHNRALAHPPVPDGELLPSALTSEGLVVAAWLNLDEERYNPALSYAQEAIGRYSQKAKWQQAEKERKGGLIHYSAGDDEAKGEIHSYGQLNDVAASYFIIGKINYILGNQEQTRRAFQEIIEEYNLAQIWDPRGWFWSPVKSIAEEYPEIYERIVYRGLLENR